MAATAEAPVRAVAEAEMAAETTPRWASKRPVGRAQRRSPRPGAAAARRRPGRSAAVVAAADGFVDTQRDGRLARRLQAEAAAGATLCARVDTSAAAVPSPPTAPGSGTRAAQRAAQLGLLAARNWELCTGASRR